MKRKKAIIILTILALFLCIGINKDFVTGTSKYRIIRVVDGDTFKVRYQGKNISVRLIGVDTPESVHRDTYRNTKWGKKASQYTKKELTNQMVCLQFDSAKYDKYGRLLAYVYVKDHGKYRMYNKKLVQKGYARAVCYEPNHKYKKEFALLQKQAKKQKLGFWKDGYKKAFP